jgi:hypothetical protein
MKKMSSPTAAALDQLLLVVMTMTMIEVLVATRCCGFHVLDGGGYAEWLLHLVVAVKKCISVKFQSSVVASSIYISWAEFSLIEAIYH